LSYSWASRITTLLSNKQQAHASQIAAKSYKN
jgi:hypothetical protein